jgi:hypothetical protein
VSRLRSLLANLALATASLAVTFAGLEVAARVAARPGPGKERDERSLYTEWDARLGWRKRPGARARYEREEYSTAIAINSHGQRDRERTWEPAPGVFRVLALGDSFLEGYSVEQEETVTHLLEARLDRPGCPVEVLNAGTTGYSSDQEYLYFVHEGHRYAPRVVMVFFHYNDVFFNGQPRYYKLGKPHLLPTGDGGIEQSNYPVWKPPATPPPAAPARERRIEGSHAWHWFRSRLIVGAPQTYDALARLGLWDPLGGDGVPDELLAYFRRRSDDIKLGWDMTDLILANLAREVKARGARLVLVYVPSMMEVDDDSWNLTRLRYQGRSDLWVRDLVVRRLERSGQTGGFDVLDLTPALRAGTGLLRPVYYPRDGHWNPAGHRLAAEDLERFLSARGWLTGC